MSCHFTEYVRAAFDEDRRILQAVHKGMANQRTTNIDLRVDAGPLRFHRQLVKRIALETEGSRPR